MRRWNHSGWSCKASTLWTRTCQIWTVISYNQTSTANVVTKDIQTKRFPVPKCYRMIICCWERHHYEHSQRMSETQHTRVGGAVLAGVKEPDLWVLSLADAGYLEVDRPASDVLGIESPLSTKNNVQSMLVTNFTIWKQRDRHTHENHNIYLVH